jgi:hypothetical protein
MVFACSYSFTSWHQHVTPAKPNMLGHAYQTKLYMANRLISCFVFLAPNSTARGTSLSRLPNQTMSLDYLMARSCQGCQLKPAQYFFYLFLIFNML